MNRERGTRLPSAEVGAACQIWEGLFWASEVTSPYLSTDSYIGACRSKQPATLFKSLHVPCKISKITRYFNVTRLSAAVVDALSKSLPLSGNAYDVIALVVVAQSAATKRAKLEAVLHSGHTSPVSCCDGLKRCERFESNPCRTGYTQRLSADHWCMMIMRSPILIAAFCCLISCPFGSTGVVPSAKQQWEVMVSTGLILLRW